MSSTYNYTTSHPRKPARPRIDRRFNAHYILLTDSTGTLFCAQPEWEALRAEREGWIIIAGNMTYDEARQYRADLYAGRTTAEDVIQESAL